MRVTYLTGQAPASVDLGPVIVPGGVGGLPVGVEGQFLGYGVGGVPVAVAAPSGGAGYDDAPLVARVVSLEQEPAPTWSEVTGKPTAFVPAVHGHSISDVTGLRAELDAIPTAYDDTALSGRVAAVEADVAAIPGPYDDTALAGRVTEVEGDVVTAQSRADAAYSLAQQGGGTGSYDDTELRGRVSTLEDAPAPTWAEVTGKPSAFTPSSHSHVIADTNGLQAALDAKAAAGHGHAIADVSGLQAVLDAISPAYDDAALSGRVTALEEAPAPYWDDVTGKPTEFTPATHGHSIGDVSGLTTALDGKASTSHSHAWTEITGKPTTFAPSAHAHAWDEITSKPTTFAPSAHGHTVAEVSGLQTALDGKQPTTTFKTVNGQAVTGSGNIATAQSFATDAEALAYSNANPGVVVFSRQVT